MRGDRVAAYARVSTREQSWEPQIERIRGWAERSGKTVVEVFGEKASGTNRNRGEFRRCMNAARTQRFDVLAVAKIDRWARSLIDLERTVSELTDLGISFYVVDNGLALNPEDPMGKAYVRFLGILAELESDLISQRTREGLEGKNPGRPAKPCACCGADRSGDEGSKRVRVNGERVRVCGGCATLSPPQRRQVAAIYSMEGIES